MFRPTAALCAGLLLLPLSATAQQQGEIPITTSSEAARDAFRQGEAYLDVGRNDEAREAFRGAVDLDPWFTYAWLSLANTAQSPGEFRGAMREASRTVGDKSEGEKLLVAVNETFLSADTDRRLELAGQLVDEYPHSPRAWLVHGVALQSVDRHAAARRSFAKTIALAPEMYAGHAALGFSLLFNEPRNPSDAVVHMEHGVKISPAEAKAHEALGDGYRALGDLAGARTAYSKALELDPKLSVASVKKGHVNSFLAHFDEARVDYDLGVRGAVGRDRVAFANYRAFVHVHAGRPEAAIRELRQLAADAEGTDLPPNDRYGVRIFTLTNAAAIATHHKLASETRAILKDRSRLMMEEAERLGDEDFTRRQKADIELWLARAAAGLGNFDMAEEALAAHRELLAPDRDPTRLQGYYLVRGLLDLHRGERHRAVNHLRKADQEDQYARYHLAVALDATGRRKESRRLFAEVADFYFNSVDYALVRKDALAKKG